jgi:hypothetical protein
MSLMKSKDFEEYEKNRWIFEGTSKFLDASDIDDNQIGIFSYYRAGNTFIRKYLESLTGISTTSNMGLLNTMVFNLQYIGFKGEQLSETKRGWCVKSHYPFVYVNEKNLKANKALVVVRNPIDIVWSTYQ